MFAGGKNNNALVDENFTSYCNLPIGMREHILTINWRNVFTSMIFLWITVITLCKLPTGNRSMRNGNE